MCVEGKVRLATLELSCLLLKQSVLSGNQCIIKDVHLACLEVGVHTNVMLDRTQEAREYARKHENTITVLVSTLIISSTSEAAAFFQKC